MSFQPAQFKNRSSHTVSPLRYAVRRSGMSQKRNCIQIILEPALAAKAGISPAAGVRLDFDTKRNLGRLIAIERERRSFRQTSSRRALIGSWPHNGDIEKFLPRSKSQDTAIVTLEVQSASKAEGLIFELPPLSL